MSRLNIVCKVPSILVTFVLSIFISVAINWSAYAFKVDTHIWVGQQIIDDLKNDHSLSFKMGSKTIVVAPDDNVTQAILNNPKVFLAGNIGPDAYPDPLVGQMVVHPGSTGNSGLWEADDWLAWLIGRAGSNDKGLAFAYGYQAHAAADIFSHTYVNHYSGRVFELTDDDHTGVETRHFLLESFIANHTPKPTGLDSYYEAVDTSAASSFVADALIFNDEVAAQYSLAGIPHLASVHKLKQHLAALEGSEWLEQMDQEVVKTLWKIYVSKYVGGYEIDNGEADKLVGALNEINGVSEDITHYLQRLDSNVHQLFREANAELSSVINQELNTQKKLLNDLRAQHDELGSLIVDAYCEEGEEAPAVSVKLLPEEACYQAYKQLDSCDDSGGYGSSTIPCGYYAPKYEQACSQYNEFQISLIKEQFYYHPERKPLIDECREDVRELACFGQIGVAFDKKCKAEGVWVDIYGSLHDKMVTDLPHEDSVCFRLNGNERIVATLPDGKYNSLDLTGEYYGPRDIWSDLWNVVTLGGNPLDPLGIVSKTISLNRKVFDLTVNVSKPFLALDKKLANELGLPYPDELMCEATQIGKELDKIGFDSAYYLTKHEVEKLQKASSLVLNLNDQLSHLHVDSTKIVADLHPKDINPIRNHIIQWQLGIDASMKAYVAANSKAIAATIKGSEVNPITPLEEWLKCWAPAVAGVPDPLSSGICDVTEHLNEIASILDDLNKVLGAGAIDAALQDLTDALLADIKEQALMAALELERYVSEPHLRFLLTTLATDATDASLNAVFASDEAGVGLLLVPDIAQRVKAEMYLTSDGVFDSNNYAVAYNAVVMAKLALLNSSQLIELANLAGDESFSTQVTYSRSGEYGDGLLLGGVRSLDGSHQWMRIAPPMPRQPGAELYDEANSMSNRLFGYDHTDGEGYGMAMWQLPKSRDLIFRELFKGPLVPGVDAPIGSFSPLLSPNHPYKTCNARPYPDDSNDRTCLVVEILVPILHLLLH